MVKITIEVEKAERDQMQAEADQHGYVSLEAYVTQLMRLGGYEYRQGSKYDDFNAVPEPPAEVLDEVRRRQETPLSESLSAEESMRRLCERQGWDYKAFSARVKQRVRK